MPLRRSLTLWLGLFGLIFLLWSWVDSNFRGSVAIHASLSASGPTHTCINLANASGAIVYTRQETTGSAVTFLPSGFAFNRHGLSGHPQWFRRPLSSRGAGILDYDPSGPALATSVLHTLTLPHWLLILAYLLLWSIAFYCRHRRIQRHLTEHPSLSPAQPQSD